MSRMLGVPYEHISLAASWIMKTLGFRSGRVFPQHGWSTLMHEETSEAAYPSLILQPPTHGLIYHVTRNPESSAGSTECVNGGVIMDRRGGGEC